MKYCTHLGVITLEIDFDKLRPEIGLASGSVVFHIPTNLIPFVWDNAPIRFEYTETSGLSLYLPPSWHDKKGLDSVVSELSTSIIDALKINRVKGVSGFVKTVRA